MQLTPPISTGIVERPTADGQLLFGDNSSGKWVRSETSEIVWDDTNKRLGIGTATPDSKLEVNGDRVKLKGDGTGGYAGAGTFLEVENISGGYAGAVWKSSSFLQFRFHNASDVVKGQFSYYMTDEDFIFHNAGSGDILFSAGNGNYAAGERMRLLANGNFGINTTSPDRKFDVLDDTNPQARFTHTDGTHYGEIQVDGNGRMKLITSGGGYGIDVAPTAVQTGYTTPSNLTTDRTFDADSTTVAELADVLGTLIEDLKAKGIISA
jgi:hypothetical protein